jgi:hypothetical protein
VIEKGQRFHVVPALAFDLIDDTIDVEPQVLPRVNPPLSKISFGRRYQSTITRRPRGFVSRFIASSIDFGHSK